MNDKRNIAVMAKNLKIGDTIVYSKFSDDETPKRRRIYGVHVLPRKKNGKVQLRVGVVVNRNGERFDMHHLDGNVRITISRPKYNQDRKRKQTNTNVEMTPCDNFATPSIGDQTLLFPLTPKSNTTDI